MRLLFLGKYREAGLLLLRVSVGCFFLYLTAPVVFGGAHAWGRFGAPLRHFGLHAHLEWWGLGFSLAQFIGAILLILGWFFRPGVLLVLVWVILHTIAVWRGANVATVTALELIVLLLSLLLVGPGKFSGDKA